MPLVLLLPEAEAMWPDGNAPQKGLMPLQRPCKAEDVKTYPMSTLVNSSLNHVPEALSSLEGRPKSMLLLQIITLL